MSCDQFLILTATHVLYAHQSLIFDEFLMFFRFSSGRLFSSTIFFERKCQIPIKYQAFTVVWHMSCDQFLILTAHHVLYDHQSLIFDELFKVCLTTFSNFFTAPSRLLELLEHSRHSWSSLELLLEHLRAS